MYYAAMERMPRNQSINASDWNRNVYKPIGLTLVFGTEALATITDAYLLYKIVIFARRRDRTENTRAKILAMTRKLFVNYLITWMMLAIDVTLKIVIMMGIPLLFDSIVSICTLAMRAKCNLEFGLELKNVLNIKSSSVRKSSKSLKHSNRKESNASKNQPRISVAVLTPNEPVKATAVDANENQSDIW
jgi:hypothetical protein